ncbi:diguanylate phosphodiesterase [Bacillus sp. M6-12]|uniref:EAL domain-containing protein n=1 Tax=Bacillus sp. M6-12 TaxID=2054166 RepID=UPI000C780B40|nr:EAL domain-containing protein [Bacillus sp. M6-12]PLS16497.1 diguanylate phosphodiesterase [Bacillus sp. M6-12]
MDALEILSDLERVFPFFQPIFSADEHRVIGYEVLGRFRIDEGCISLGSFLQDETIPEEYRVEVDNLILKKALEKAEEQEGNDSWLFINRDPNLLMLDHGEEFLAILKSSLKTEQLNRVVLELSETIYNGELNPLLHLLEYYKTYGIKIAIDHIGQESHLDRIAQLSPQILKVNLDMIRQSGGSYREFLYSLGMMARKIGANLLFENIETVYQLQFAWKNGGRYYQGFYLAKPGADFIDKDLLRVKFKNECHGFIVFEKKKLEAIYSKTMQYNNGISLLLSKYKRYEKYPELLQALAEELKDKCFRLYVCDSDGFQQSPNVFQNQGGWSVQQDYYGKNWSWRPYFLETIVKMRNEKKGILSDLYSDIETGETIRTFSYPLLNGDYLFIDLSYSYLYENEDLL